MENNELKSQIGLTKEIREQKCSEEVNLILKKYDCKINIIFVIEEDGSKMSFHKNIISNG